MNSELLNLVSIERLRHDLFYLCRDPFTFRTVMYTAPWHTKNSLDETDDFISAEMSKYAKVNMIPYKLRPFRCDSSKPLHHWYSSPLPDDPWYDAHCIEVIIPGTEKADEIIQLVSHKDSMSWINSSGAQDNATGTVVNLELVRVLSSLKLRKTVRVLFCNEEHTPWYSLDYAKASKERGDNIIAVLNQDSPCGKSDAALANGIMTSATTYCTPEAEELADMIVKENEIYNLGLVAYKAPKAYPNDDDGSFIKAGYPRAVMNCGSSPYGDPQYHLQGDVPERVDLMNLLQVTKLILATVLDHDLQ